MVANRLGESEGSWGRRLNLKIGLKRMILRCLARIGLHGVAINLIEIYCAFGAKKFVLGPEAPPIPPATLMVRVAGHANAAVFLEGGQRAANAITGSLDRAGVSIGHLSAILDFGCGCGRVLRHWHHTGARFYGSDLDGLAIKWCRHNLPFGEFAVNRLKPPISYPDSSFDLIYALSVLTHLPVDTQFAWRDEFWRVMRPGGYLLLTLHGDAYLSQLTPAEWAMYSRGDCIVRLAQIAGSNHCCAYHPLSFVRDRLAKGWELVEHVPRGALGNPEQDLILLRKPAEVVTAASTA